MSKLSPEAIAEALAAMDEAESAGADTTGHLSFEFLRPLLEHCRDCDAEKCPVCLGERAINYAVVGRHVCPECKGTGKFVAPDLLQRAEAAESAVERVRPKLLRLFDMAGKQWHGEDEGPIFLLHEVLQDLSALDGEDKHGA